MNVLAKLFGHRINEPDPNDAYWRKVEDARETLARDVEARRKLVGQPYSKRRAAALKATRG